MIFQFVDEFGEQFCQPFHAHVRLAKTLEPVKLETRRRGQIDFRDGTCTVVARPGALALRVEADDDATVARLADAVGRCLSALYSGLRVAWSPARDVDIGSRH